MATKTILLHGEIEGDFFIFESENSAKAINRQLNQAVNEEDTDQVILGINSPGGSVMEGIAIYNEITRLNREGNTPINTRIDGVAYSMGAVIAMAGKKVSGYKNITFMLHNASGITVGNAQDMQSTVDALNAVDAGMAENIAAKTGKTVDQVKNDYMNYKDNFYSARDAQKEGFIDELIEEESSTAKDLQGKSIAEAFAYFREQGPKAGQSTFGQGPKNNDPSTLQNFKNWVKQLVDDKTKGQGSTPEPPKPPKNEEKMKISAKLAALAALFNVQPTEEAPVDVEPSEENLNALNQRLENLTALEQEREQERQALTTALQEAGLDENLTGTEAVQALQNHVKELGNKPPQYPGQGNLNDPPQGPEPQNEFRTEEDIKAEEILNFD